MFTPWIKRTAIKRKSAKRSDKLVLSAMGVSPILLLSMMGLFIALGIFVVQRSYAAGTLITP